MEFGDIPERLPDETPDQEMIRHGMFWQYMDGHHLGKGLAISGAVALGGIAAAVATLESKLNVVEKVAAVGAATPVAGAGVLFFAMFMESPRLYPSNRRRSRWLR